MENVLLNYTLFNSFSLYLIILYTKEVSSAILPQLLSVIFLFFLDINKWKTNNQSFLL